MRKYRTEQRNLRRVVITGLGVVAPNGFGISDFLTALQEGRSGISRVPQLEELAFRCLVAGVPTIPEQELQKYFTEEDLLTMNEAMIFGAIAALEAWRDGGLEVPARDSKVVFWDAGCVIGSGLSGIDTVASLLVPMVNAGKTRRMGSSVVERTMASGISAKLSGFLALGNQVTSNSSACNTGTEAICDAYLRIQSGLAEKMLAGGAEAASPYIWAGFDSMRVLSSAFNETPSAASRPMSSSAAGFVPAAGSGVLLLESLESALERRARIYAEIVGTCVNCGGQRNGGSMTAPNCESVVRCIQTALSSTGIDSGEVDAINGHLTATMADPLEVQNWARALHRTESDFPFIQSTKSLIGHCLGAAGAIETVAAVLQMEHGFLHPSVNSEDLHPEVLPFASRVVREKIDRSIHLMAKASFGFGDVNGCLLLRKWI